MLLSNVGAIVDASITDSPRRPRGRKEYEIVEDRDEETGKLKSEKAMLKEKLKPKRRGTLDQENGKAPLWIQTAFSYR